MNKFLPLRITLFFFFFLSFSFRRNKCQSAIVDSKNIDFKVEVIDNLIHDACIRWPRMGDLNGQRKNKSKKIE